MKPQLAAAFRRAGARVRESDLLGAARLLQNSLFGDAGAAQAPCQPEEERRNGPTPSSAASAAEPAPNPAAEHDHAPAEASRGPSGLLAEPRQSRPLGATLRLLEEGRAALAFSPAALRRRTQISQILQMPEGARFEARSFACPEGSRDYRLYVPSRAGEGLRGLVVMLHGCKQDAEDFAIGTAMNHEAERERLLVAYPRQTVAHNALACWNWFNPADQKRGSGEPAVLAGIARGLIAEFEVEGSRAMVAGLSAGGSMAAVLGATYPDLFGTVGIHSGLPYGIAHDAASAFAVMRGEPGNARSGVLACRTIVFHGSEDRTVHPNNAGRLLVAAGAGEARRAAGTSRGGRAYRIERLVDARGASQFELWMVEGAGHAWSGGDPAGSYTDPDGPRASAELVRFFLEQ